MMQIVLEGGSEDGRVLSVPDGERVVLIPILTNPIGLMNEDAIDQLHRWITIPAQTYRITDRGSSTHNAVVFELTEGAP